MQDHAHESKQNFDEMHGPKRRSARRFVFTKLGFTLIVGFFGVMAGLISAIVVVAIIFSPNYSLENRSDARITSPSADRVASDRAHGVMLKGMAMMEDQIRAFEGLETDLDQATGHDIFNTYPVEELLK